MFKINEIKDLIKLLDQTSIHELELEQDGTKIVLRKPNRTETVMVATSPNAIQIPNVAPVHNVTPTYAMPASVSAAPAPIASAPAAPTAPEVDANLHKITSPMVGTFYRAPGPTSPSFANVGDRVNAKSVVCIVEAMKLMNEIEAEVEGEIVEVLVENGQLVEFGQALFLVRV